MKQWMKYLVIVIVSLLLGSIFQSIRPVLSQPVLTVEGILNTALGTVVRSFNVTAPGAGTDFLQTVPSGKRWRIMAGRAQLTTSSSAGNRTIGFRIDDGNAPNLFGNYGISTAPIPASTVALFNFGNFGSPVAPTSGGETIVNIPSGILLNSGWRFYSATGGLLAGDQWSTIWLAVEEWTR
jgi:hypothetical protein